MHDLFNSSFETGLRILLVLFSIQPQAATVDRITAYDFITVYGKEFGVSKTNLHGDSNFIFSELAARRDRCINGIKEFVLSGLISINRTEGGFLYYISQSGNEFINSLSSDYATQYLRISNNVQQKFSSLSDEEIINLINNKAILGLRRMT